MTKKRKIKTGQDFISPKRRHDEARVAVLTVEGHEGKIYELAGDEAYTLDDLAAEILRRNGKTIPFHLGISLLGKLPQWDNQIRLKTVPLTTLFETF